MIAHVCAGCGTIYIAGNDSLVTAVSWLPIGDQVADQGTVAWAVSAIEKYLSGSLKTFPGMIDIKDNRALWMRRKSALRDIEPQTLFEKILHQIAQIPYGHTLTYGDIARKLGNKGLARAVGQACKKNPLAVVIPCHRVLGHNSIGGYNSGIFRKEYLLGLEKEASDKDC